MKIIKGNTVIEDTGGVIPENGVGCEKCAKLQAENKRLREALEDIIEECASDLCLRCGVTSIKNNQTFCKFCEAETLKEKEGDEQYKTTTTKKRSRTR